MLTTIHSGAIWWLFGWSADALIALLPGFTLYRFGSLPLLNFWSVFTISHFIITKTRLCNIQKVFLVVKMKIFTGKILIYLIFAQNIDCGQC